MPEAISNYVASMSYPGNSWGEQDYDFPERPTNAASYATPRCRIYRLPVVYETKPEITKVEGFVAGAPAHELAETSENDLVVGMQESDAAWECTTVYVLDARCEEVAGIEGQCVEFCHSRGLTTTLEECLKQARRIFVPTVHISPEIDLFEEDAADDTGHVVIRVRVQADRATTQEQYNAWLDWFVENVGDTRRSLITLAVRRV